MNPFWSSLVDMQSCLHRLYVENGTGPGAMSDTERTSDQCPPTPPPLTDNHLNSDVWSIKPSRVSGT